jgi:uncharacterized protein (DUF427 family)
VTLTSGRGPLSPDPAGRFTPPIPSPTVYVEPFQRRVRGIVAGRAVIDSERVLLVHRPGHPPSYAFPADAVAEVPTEPVPEAPGHVRVPWGAVDAWFEEEDQILGTHPRNPYHRVECLTTRRRLVVEIEGVVLVDTDDTLGVFETALLPLLYVRRDDVRMDLLSPSPTTTYCGYKGTASYWTATVDGVVVPDVAWSYDDPFPEFHRGRGRLTFDAARATVRHDLPLA